MENIINIIISNWEVSTSIGAMLIVGIDYIVKHTKNKIDDAIWNKIKNPLVNFVKDYFNNKRTK